MQDTEINEFSCPHEELADSEHSLAGQTVPLVVPLALVPSEHIPATAGNLLIQEEPVSALIQPALCEPPPMSVGLPIQPQEFDVLSSSTDKIKPIFIELCSGSARLSLHMQSLGCHVIPIDHKRNDHKSLVPAIIIDLSDAEQCDIILNLLVSGNVAVIAAGIPCGTSSRAREIPLPGGEDHDR